jgi:hypothetical protein
MVHPFLLAHENTLPRGRILRPGSKKPGAVSRPGGWRNFGEYALLEDSRYTSQAFFSGNLQDGLSPEKPITISGQADRHRGAKERP